MTQVVFMHFFTLVQIKKVNILLSVKRYLFCIFHEKYNHFLKYYEKFNDYHRNLWKGKVLGPKMRVSAFVNFKPASK